jgi:hypothetical protein
MLFFQLCDTKVGRLKADFDERKQTWG